MGQATAYGFTDRKAHRHQGLIARPCQAPQLLPCLSPPTPKATYQLRRQSCLRRTPGAIVVIMSDDKRNDYTEVLIQLTEDDMARLLDNEQFMIYLIMWME